MEGGGSLQGAAVQPRIWKEPHCYHVVRCCRLLVREDPLGFGGDKRGRGRQLEEAILRGPLNSRRDDDALNEQNWWYGPADSTDGCSVPFIAARLGLPEAAAVVRIED